MKWPFCRSDHDDCDQHPDHDFEHYVVVMLREGAEQQRRIEEKIDTLASPGDPAALDALTAKLKTSEEDLQAAVSSNTPAAP